ncbi:MAG: hypothetical protein U9R28_06920 [Pseudomonadota bacterium]|nr:hypothetical protein [Pseudomonadota bacterium]
MSDKTQEEIKLEELLSIDDTHHTSEQRTSIIIQGVNWLTLLQDVMVLFFYKLPSALISMLQTTTQKKES